MSSPDRHFLSDFKKTIDQGNPRTLHVCFEASHPEMLGRPSDLVIDLLMAERFLVDVGAPQEHRIIPHFIPDRLSVPKLRGNVLVLGGPRANVVARIALEYEAQVADRHVYYHRHKNPHFPLEYTYVYRNDYSNRIYTDISGLDAGCLDAAQYYSAKIKPNTVFQDVELFSVPRVLKRRNGETYTSLSASMTTENKNRDVLLVDHFIETLMPNVFDSADANTRIMVINGIRDLGTFAGLCCLYEHHYLNALAVRLKHMTNDVGAGRFAARQIGWRVARSMEQFLLKSAATPTQLEKADEDLFDALKADNAFILARNGMSIQITPHVVANNARDFEIDKKVLKAFRKKVIGDEKSRSPNARSIQISEINADRILDAMSLPRDQFYRRQDIYTLGCFERKKTVYTQQARALTLIHALYKSGKIRNGTTIAIVGGGVSGMAAATAAVAVGARVTLLEKSNRLAPIQRDSANRYLHPFFYDWPAAGCNTEAASLPLPSLSWEAGFADTVFNKLVRAFKKYKKDVNKGGDRQLLTVKKQYEASLLLFDRASAKHILSNQRFDEDPLDEGAKRSWKQQAGDLIRAVREGKREKNGADEAELTGSVDNKVELKPGVVHDVVDADIIIFATGFGVEEPEAFCDKPEMNGLKSINGPYWVDDSFPKAAPGDKFVVSGAGDGALVDILRLCIQQFNAPEWHKDFFDRMNQLIGTNDDGIIRSNRPDLLVFASELALLFRSDRFRRIEDENERLAMIDGVMAGFDVDEFLEQLQVDFCDVEIYNVSKEPQPFWADAAIAHVLVVWCLHKKNRVRFIRGTIEKSDKKTVWIRRKIGGALRKVTTSGVVIRHGVDKANSHFLKIQGLMTDMNKSEEEVASDGERLVSLLRLSNTLHPETEKFFRHTVPNLS